MRVSKALGSFVAIGAALVALTSTTESRAGDESLVTVACNNGNLTVKPATGAFHINKAAPWKWEGWAVVSVNDSVAVFKGAACSGKVSVYICTSDQSQCKSFKVDVH